MNDIPLKNQRYALLKTATILQRTHIKPNNTKNHLFSIFHSGQKQQSFSLKRPDLIDLFALCHFQAKQDK
ncbi:hypothetical protein VN23_14095 [Janthinobacterium sp. B9-8]|nr:hypothetical protein VN23_14095 [Janthinobacterium sp. B9-8]